MHLVCFPWAGGTGALYALWLKHLAIASTFSSVVRVDYPGRASWSDAHAIEDVELLVASILERYECFEKNKSEEIVLFGHSFGAIVAYEVARRLEEEGHPPKAVFVSASAPPSKFPLVQTEVSKLSVGEICDYFASKGNPVGDDVIQNEEFLDMFIGRVRADYKCLESYVTSNHKLGTPLIVVGGGMDPGVSLEDLNGWKKHVDDTLTRFWMSKPGRSSSGDEDIAETEDKVLLKVFHDQGHFYLKSANILTELGDFIVATVNMIIFTPPDEEREGGSRRDARPDEEREGGSRRDSREGIAKGAETKRHVSAAFRKALGIAEAEDVPLHGHFFDELGGTSLDTFALISYLQGVVGLRITQNEFILHPTVHSLTQRILELQVLMTNAPTLDPIDLKAQEWFPASAGQEQMIALWETAPAMYNMPTTIEFHGNLDVRSLRLAMEHVVKQQDGLRTLVRFDLKENKVSQKVLPQDCANECLEFVEMEACGDEDARVLVEKESGFIFHLDKPPVVRAVLVKVKMSNTYLLLLNQHHVGSDGWSRTQQRRQYLKAYLALKNGEDPATLPEHPSYLDWTMYTRRLLHEHGHKEKQLKYWQEKLKDLPVLDMPLDHPRPLVLSSHGARIPVSIPPELIAQFSRLTARENSNLFVGLLSLYMSLLHIWGGGERFSIGVAMANRQHEGLEDLVGYFANECAIVADFNGDPSFLEHLSRIRTNVLGAMANADVPFHEVCEALKVERSSSRTSVFQAMFALQEREWHSVDDLNPEETEDHFNLKQYNHNTSKFEVHLQLRYDGRGGLEGDFHIATDLFTIKTGERLVEAYKYLMQACVDNPQVPVAKHDILPQVDREIINRSNQTNRSFDNSSLWSQIEGIGSLSTAFRVVTEDGTTENISYDSLRSNVKSVTKFLLSCQAQGNTVGILIRNSAEGIMIILGTMLASSTAVILDIDKTPIERLNLIFEDSHVQTVLVLDENEEIIKSLKDSWSVHAWRDVVEKGTCAHSAPIRPPNNGAHKFALYYTSGTTGRPKGVVIELANVMNLVNWWVDYFGLKPNDRCMLFSSLSFIMSIRQWLPPLTVGASVTIPRSSFEFEMAITSTQVNKLVCTPSALAALDRNRIENMDAVQVAGEAPQNQTMEMWNKKVKELHIGLGPTELCAHALCGKYDGNTVCIGHPASNVRAYVVNKFGRQCPIGCIGELWIAGSNVALGYLNQETETRKHFSTDAFVNHAVPSEGSLRLYKAGDLCRRLTDGSLDVISIR